MKSLYAIGTIALMLSSVLSANEMESKDCVTLSSETLNLTELLSYVEDTVWQLLNADEETQQLAYHELKEGLKIIYTLNCLYPEEACNILQALDECYAFLSDAADRDPSNSIVLESLLLFPSGRNYEHETFIALSLQELANTTSSNELRSTLETADANLVYIQENVFCDNEEHISLNTPRNTSRLFYNAHSFQSSNPKIVIIKSSKHKSKAETGIDMKLGGKDHGKTSFYFKAEVEDKDGNYAKAKVSKEEDGDGYDCKVRAGKKEE